MEAFARPGDRTKQQYSSDYGPDVPMADSEEVCTFFFRSVKGSEFMGEGRATSLPSVISALFSFCTR